MKQFITLRRLIPTVLYLLMGTFSAVSIAADSASIVNISSDYESGLIFLAQSEADDKQNQVPESGTVVIPASAEKDEAEKKCMTVCQRWGQECMYDNNRGRKCRRTCKEFGQECF